MTFTYPAVFTKKEDGTGFHAFFPDLEMCEADGADLEDAIENARDAAQNWISVELEEFEGDLPFATHVDDIELGGESGCKADHGEDQVSAGQRLTGKEPVVSALKCRYEVIFTGRKCPWIVTM